MKSSWKKQRLTAKKHIEHVIGTIKHDGHLGTIQTDWILPDLEKALAALEGGEEIRKVLFMELIHFLK